MTSRRSGAGRSEESDVRLQGIAANVPGLASFRRTGELDFPRPVKVARLCLCEVGLRGLVYSDIRAEHMDLALTATLICKAGLTC